MERCNREGFHGQVRVVYFQGQVKQVVLESSYVDPEALASEGE